MSTVIRKFMGGLGNQMFMYAFARAYAEKHGHTLETERWVGQEIFNINDPLPSKELPPVNGKDLAGEGDVEIRGYSQDQECMIYTREQAKKWFALKPELLERLKTCATFAHPVSHRRVGDYLNNCYPVISPHAYRRAWEQYGYSPMPFVTAEDALVLPSMPRFLPDFYRLCVAPVMFRANSTFSWWAGVLNDGKVYSPVTAGLTYKEHDDVPFIEGNYARICDLDVCTCVCLAKE